MSDTGRIADEHVNPLASNWSTSEPPSDSTFDVEAWLAEAAPPQRAVVLYGRADLISELENLLDQREHDDTPPSLAGRPIDAKIRNLRGQIDASRKVFHVRGLLIRERTDLTDLFTSTKKGEDGKDEEVFDATGYECEAIARALVSPTLTAAQTARLHQAIGEAQWLALVRGVEAASSEQVDVPLSRLDSENTQNS